MAKIDWAAAVNGIFQDPTKWTGDTAPGTADTAVLGALGGTAYTVVSRSGTGGLALGGTQTVEAIQTAANAKLQIVGDIDVVDLLTGDTTFDATSGTGDGMNAGTIVVQDAVDSITVLGVTHLLGASANFRASGTLGNTGLISINGQPHLLGLLDSDQQARMIVDNSLMLTGGGRVTMSNQLNNFIRSGLGHASLTNANNTISGAGFIGGGGLAIVNESAGVIDADDSRVLTLHTSAGVTNSGLIEATNHGRLVISSTKIDDSASGTVLAADSSRVVLQDADIVGGAIESTLKGAIVIDKRGSVLDGRSSTVTIAGMVHIRHGSALTIEGAIDNTGKVLVGATTKFPLDTDLIIASAGATLTGGGQVNMTTLPENGIHGVSASATLTNVDNTINGGGELGAGTMILINEAAGVIRDGGSASLTIDTGANIITNAGEIIAAAHGRVVVDSAIDNTGLLSVSGGTMILNGAVTGSGGAAISGGSLTAASTFSENVTFDATGVLRLADSADYGGTIKGFSHTGGTSLDLTDIAFGGGTKASFAGSSTGGVLTVTDGTHTANIHLTGNYLGATFMVANDGHGGTTVQDPAAGQASRLAVAMAQVGAPTSGHVATSLTMAPHPTMSLAAHMS